jgi:hypothetical protein
VEVAVPGIRVAHALVGCQGSGLPGG